MSRIKLTVAAALLIACAALIFTLISQPTLTSAQAETNNMRVMIEALNQRVSDEPGFEMLFQFVQPPLGGETLIMVSSESGRSIGGVGDDYVCIGERWNNSRRYHCTPFANLVSVSYIE